MSSTLSHTQPRFSAGRWITEPSVDVPLQPTDLDQFPSTRPSLGKRASGVLARFLITFCIGVAATLAWQSYGDAVREMIASSYPLLGWLAPQTAPVAQTAPMIAPAVPVAPSADQQQIRAMSLDLAVMRQSVDQLAAKLSAGQERLMSDITKLQAIEQDILDKITAPPPPSSPAEAPTRKLVPPPPRAPPVR
jgi:hypothetical protein